MRTSTYELSIVRALNFLQARAYIYIYVCVEEEEAKIDTNKHAMPEPRFLSHYTMLRRDFQSSVTANSRIRFVTVELLIRTFIVIRSVYTRHRHPIGFPIAQSDRV